MVDFMFETAADLVIKFFVRHTMPLFRQLSLIVVWLTLNLQS